MGRVFANGPGDLGSIPKTLKMVLDTSLLNTQQYKVRIEGEVEQSREKISVLPYTSVQELLKREPPGCLSRESPTATIYIYIYIYIYMARYTHNIYIYIYIYIYIRELASVFEH